MICQMTLGGEGLLASLEVADIRLLPCVNAHVSFQVAFFSEPLIAYVTFVRFLSRLVLVTYMCSDMDFESA